MEVIMNKYPTSDGHEFIRERDAMEWQAALDYKERLACLEEPYGIGQFKLTLKHLTDAVTLRKYLVYYLGFDIEQVDKIPLNIGEGDIVVLVDRSTKEVEVL